LTLTEFDELAKQHGLRVFKSEKTDLMSVYSSSEFIVEDIPEAKLELSKAMDKVATAHDQLAEAEHELNEAIDRIPTTAQEKTAY
jgi:hypothetical protein